MVYHPDDQTATVFATISVNIFTGSLFYLLFELFRYQKDIYTSKCRERKERTPSMPSKGLFQWIINIIKVSDEETLQRIGMDAYIFLRFMRLCSKFCIISGLLGGLILCPVYYTSYGEQIGIAGINLYTMGNIQPGGKRLWASCAFCWIFNLFFLYLMHNEYRCFVTLRQRFLYDGDQDIPAQQSYSVMVENIPFYYRSPKRLQKLFNEWFPNQIHSTYIACNVNDLNELIQKREEIVGKLEVSIAYYHGSKEQDRKLVHLYKDTPIWFALSSLTTSVDAIDYYQKELIRLNNEILTLQSKLVNKNGVLLSPEVSSNKLKHLLSSFVNPLLLKQDNRSVSFTSEQQNIQEIQKLEQEQEKEKEQYHEQNQLPQQYYQQENLSISFNQINNNHNNHNNQNGHENNNSKNNGLISSSSLSSPPPPSSPNELSINSNVENTINKQINHQFDDHSPSPDISQTDYGYHSSTGFITFLSRSTQVLSYQVKVLSDIYSNIEISQAPTHDDIIWENLTVTKEQQQHGANITNAIFSLGMLFWGTVLAFIAAVSNLSNLEKYLPFIKNLNPVLYSLLAGILPVIVMNLFLSLLPAIFGYGAEKIEKRKTKSEVQQFVFQWYFGYQLANVYLTLLTGSLFTALADAIADPASIIRLLAAALPSVSVFFINYIITEILTTAPSELLQLVPFLIYNAYKFLFKEEYLTRRTLFNGPLQTSEFDYGSALPSYLFIVCIVLTYMIIAPVITILGAFYFSIFYCILKYQFLYIYVPSFETGGKFWYGLYNFSMKGLFVSSITMIGYMAVKQGVAQAPFVFPIPFIILKYWNYTTASFERVSKDMAYSRAVQADNDIEIHQKHIESFDTQFYTQPALVEKWDVTPEPYRLNNIPLFQKFGHVDEIYYEDGFEDRVDEYESTLNSSNKQQRDDIENSDGISNQEMEVGISLSVKSFDSSDSHSINKQK